jgi:regulator of protease activity HflC (stomatin/prohibitin superfamily)
MFYMRKILNRFRDWISKHTLQFVVVSFVILASGIVLWPTIHVSIPVGFVGVLFRPIWKGTDLSLLLNEGINLKLPWDTVTKYDGRIQQKVVTVDVLTSDLLKSTLTVSYQFRVYESNVPLLHKYIGPDYISKFVEPSIVASVRNAVGKLSSTEAFTKHISTVEQEIRQGSDLSIINNISPPGISEVRLVRIEAIEFQDFSFPKEVADAINNKMVASAKAQSYPFILESERSEAQRKEIEAEGIRKFQDIVRPGLSDSYLRWRGIEATQNLASSSNSKIIVFGQGPTGLPLIMGDMDKTPVSPNKSGK